MDPGMIQKRLGDGFYEQKLVADQILQATGKRNLTGFSNIQSSYQALMDEALSESQGLKLIPGVALTKDQIAALRHDIVWMVAEDVKLPDGSTVKALAPKVYFSQSSQMRLNQGGALIAANEITMQTGGVLDNQGRIISDTATNLIVGDLVNHGAVQSGGVLYLQAANDVNNLSGTLAGRDVQIIAGRDINNQRVNDESGLHQQGNIIAGNNLNMAAGRDISMAAGGIQTGGNANLAAAGKVDIGVLETHNSNRGGNNSYIDTTTNLGSTLDIGGNLAVQSGKDMTLTAATLNAGGNMTLLSGGNLDIKAAKDTRSSGYSSEINQARNYDETVRGSTLTAGGNLILAATARKGEGDEDQEGHSSGHNIKLESATLTSNTGTLALVADNSVNIGVTEEKHSAYFATHEENNGRFYSKSTDRRTLSQQTYAIGSELSGESVLIVAGKQGSDDHGKDGNINVTGSSIAGTGDVTLQAANDVSIQAATSTSRYSSYSHTSESGLMSNGGLSITIGEREQTDKFDSTSTLQSQNRSLVGSTGGNLNIKAGGNARVGGSDLVAAKDLNVEAQDITINSGFDQTTATQSHDVHQSGLTISLSSNYTSAAQTVDQMRELGKQTQNSRTKALAAATTALALGNAYNAGPSVSVSATVGSSDSHSDSTQISRSSSGSMLNAGGNINLTASSAKGDEGSVQGGNLTIQGSDVKAGNDINLSADRDIRLLAEQNSYSQVSHNSSSSSGAGVSVSYGSGGGTYGYTVNAATAHGNADGSDISYTNTHLAAANALNIKSGGDTTLRGAIATGKQVTTDIGGNLAVESLQDTSTYGSQQRGEGGSVTFGPASGASINASQSHINSDYNSVIEQSGIQAGDDGYRVAAHGNTDLKGAVIAASDAGLNKSSFNTGGTLTQSDLHNSANYDAEASGFSAGVGGNGPGGSGPSGSAGVGSDSGSAAGTTKSAIGVSTKADTTGKVDQIFDAQRVNEEINAQVQITQAFSQQVPKAVASFSAAMATSLRKEGNEEEAKKWDEGGSYRVLFHTVSGALSGGVNGAGGAFTTSSAAPLLDEMQAKVQEALVQQGMSAEGAKLVAQGLAEATSAGMGAVVGGAQGAASGFTVDTNNRQLHPDERKLIAELGKKKAQEICGDDSKCRVSATIYWTDLLEQTAKGLVDDRAYAKNQQYFSALLGTAINPDSEGSVGGGVQRYFSNLNSAQNMLVTYMGQPIEVNGVQITGDGSVQRYFSATEAQRADPYLNSLFPGPVDPIIPGKDIRDQDRLEYFSVQNGSATRDSLPEELLVGGKAAKVLTDALASGWRGLEVGLAGKTVSSTTGNISASQITEAGMGATLSATERATLAQLDNLPSTALQGEAREYVTNSYLVRNGFQPLEGKCGSGNCFDGVFVKGDTVYVVEVKPLNANGSIKLSGPSQAGLPPQMSDTWIDDAVRRLANSSSSEARETAAIIKNAIDNQSLVKIVTGVNSNGMTIVKLK